MYWGCRPSGFISENDEKTWERLRNKLLVEVKIHSPPLNKNGTKSYRKRKRGKTLTVYLNKIVIHDWR